MSSPRPPAAVIVAAFAALVTACATPVADRASLDRIAGGWATAVGPDDQRDLIAAARRLGAADPTHPESLVSMIALARQARPRGNPSALVRADCLRAAWVIGAQGTPEALATDAAADAGLAELVAEFESLTADPARSVADPRAVELAARLGAYRFPPGDEDLALDLADLVVSRGLWMEPGPIQAAFLGGAAGVARHALVLVTLRAADDSRAVVREEALRAARHLQPGPGVDLVAGALAMARERTLLLAALDSLEHLALAADPQDVARVLGLVPGDAELPIRRRVAALREALAE